MKRNVTGALAIFLQAAASLVLLVASPERALAAQRDEQPAVSWLEPTPAEGSIVSVAVGETLSLSVLASAPDSTAVVQIDAALPDGASSSSTGGNPAALTIEWTPTAADEGDHRVGLTARAGDDVSLRGFVIRVGAASPRTITHFTLSGIGHNSRWAQVLRPVAARSAPSLSAPVVARVTELTPQGTRNLLLLLDGETKPSGDIWIRVRLPVRPNNVTGWVQRSALGTFRVVSTHLFVDRERFTATLLRGGRTIFRTRVGVGRPQWPTPAGEFYVRVRQTNFFEPFFGPVAFGTSARTMALLNWPGGGFIGIHGTSMPWLLPGRVSHGCIRMRNAAILKLSLLMPIGTPVTIT